MSWKHFNESSSYSYSEPKSLQFHCFVTWWLLYETHHKKACFQTSLTSVDVYQSVWLFSVNGIINTSSIHSLQSIEASCRQQWLWPDCRAAQADLGLCLLHKLYYTEVFLKMWLIDIFKWKCQRHLFLSDFLSLNNHWQIQVVVL